MSGDALEGVLGSLPLTGMKWGLGRTREMLRRLGNPERDFRSLHVGGTNGKGSVAAAAEAVLRRSGHRTGLFTSPHLLEYAERFRVDGRPIDPEAGAERAREVVRLARELEASRFEAETALAFLLFREAGVDLAVVEVGLGGRLDATNVLRPAACAIASVAVDHTDLLGETLTEIAREKAGILAPGVPCALGSLGEEPLRVFRDRAREVGTDLRRLGREATVEHVRFGESGTRFTYRSRHRPAGVELELPLAGRHQAENAGVALIALESLPEPPDEEAVAEGLAGLSWPGRFQRFPTAEGEGEWIVDVAHNPASMAATLETLRRIRPPRPWIWVLAVLADKDWEGTVGSALGVADGGVLTVAPSSPGERRWDPERARRRLRGGGGSPGSGDPIVEPEFERALARARELAGGGTVLVGGSCFTAGDALRRLGASDGGSADRGRRSGGTPGSPGTA